MMKDLCWGEEGLNWAQEYSSFASSFSKWRRFIHNSTDIMQQKYRNSKGDFREPACHMVNMIIE